MSGDKTAAATGKTRGCTIFGVNSSMVTTLVVVMPIIYTIVVYPDSFSLSWNQGRGGFLFAMVFIAAELIGTKYQFSKTRFLIVASLAALTIAYFAALPAGLGEYILEGADYYPVSLKDSWVWMWDFVVMSLFVGSSLVILFGRKWYKIAPAGAIYLAGSAVILALDAFFPFDTLGPLQVIVPVYLIIDAGVINFIDDYVINVGPENPANPADPAIIRNSNFLILNGLHGPFALRVFWPSAGVHSMIIYTLVMLAFLLKMEIPLRRKMVYFAIGTFGTVGVNIIRITSLSLYALVVTTNVSEWEAFHSVAGEIMFLPWLGIYLGFVMFVESKRFRKEREEANAAATASTTPREP
ncbi:MAG TPA: thaumarchaeosortase [Nitrososphaera sp.]|nr:thaumarchaeosortase [Nitrososphaera sp.]